MERPTCEELHTFYGKYIEENKQTDDLFFGALTENIKNKKYLTPLELISILSWKIGYYLGIGRYMDSISIKGTEEVKLCSSRAFRLVDDGQIEEALLEFANLLDIKWKTITIPSAILCFYAYPNLPVIDRYAWLALYGEERGDFEVSDYKKYRDDIMLIARECKLSPRAIDCSLYQMGRPKK